VFWHGLTAVPNHAQAVPGGPNDYIQRVEANLTRLAQQLQHAM
jgi:hypothetical protein